MPSLFGFEVWPRDIHSALVRACARPNWRRPYSRRINCLDISGLSGWGCGVFAPAFPLSVCGQRASRRVSRSADLGACICGFPPFGLNGTARRMGHPTSAAMLTSPNKKSHPFEKLARSRLRIFAAHIGGFLPFAPKNAAREMGHPFPWRYLPPNTCDAYFAKYKRWALSLALVRGACNL
jgi:hypothetical protein